MPVPKRRSSKRRKRIRKFENTKRKMEKAIKTKDGKGYKRPHVDEYVEP